MKLFLTFLLTLAANQLFAQSAPSPDAKEMPNHCASSGNIGDLSGGPAWNGWGVDASNARFQTGKDGAVTARSNPSTEAEVGFRISRRPSSVFGQPTSSADACSSASIPVLSMRSMPPADVSTGSYRGGGGRAHRHHGRTHRPGPLRRIFRRSQGQRLRRECRHRRTDLEGHVEDHPAARITGAPKFVEGRLYVPVCLGRGGRRPQCANMPAARFAAAWWRWMPRPAARSGRPTPSPKSPSRGKIRRPRPHWGPPAPAFGTRPPSIPNAARSTWEPATPTPSPPPKPPMPSWRSISIPARFSGSSRTPKTTPGWRLHRQDTTRKLPRKTRARSRFRLLRRF